MKLWSSNGPQALKLQLDLCEKGLEFHPALANELLSAFAEAGRLSCAEQVFQKIVSPDSGSWNPLIAGYGKIGQPHVSIAVYQKMQLYDDSSLSPSWYSFVALLKACSALQDKNTGIQLHSHIVRNGLLQSEICVASAVVDMYAKFGCLCKAHEVHQWLPFRDVVSWTALIRGYVEHGEEDHAVDCLQEMRYDGISPNAFTFASILKACGNITGLDKGEDVHAEVVKKGLETDTLVGNTLVDMYSKCGNLASAEKVFSQLQVQTEVSWTALIAGYVEDGYNEYAFSCLKDMQSSGVVPDDYTFVCCLKASAGAKSRHHCKELHTDVIQKGLDSELLVVSALIDAYAKLQLLVEAQFIFDRTPSRDVVSWTLILAMYVEYGRNDLALEHLSRMKDDGLPVNAITYVWALQACGNVRDSTRGREIHTQILCKSFENEFVGSALINMYAKCGLLLEAQNVFEKLPFRHVVFWTALMTGYTEQGCTELVLACFERMQQHGIPPNSVTYICLLKACCSRSTKYRGQDLHSEIIKKGLESDSGLANTLLDMYSKCGLLEAAYQVFEKIDARDVVSWNVLIGGYIDHGYSEQGMQCLEQMQNEGSFFDAVTYICASKACGTMGAAVKCLDMHLGIVKKGLEEELLVGNALLDMYGKCGTLPTAQAVFDKLKVRDMFSWNVLIAACSQVGECVRAFQLFEMMIEEGIVPNQVTVANILSAGCHSGEITLAVMFFATMIKECRFIPTIDHYSCIVDLFGRAGRIDEAVAVVRNMPFHPDIVIWHSMLGACRKSGDVGLGRHAFEHATGFPGKDAVVYISMYQIYVGASMLEEAYDIQQMRTELMMTET